MVTSPRSDRGQSLDFVLKHSLLVIKQVTQRIVDREHRHRHIAHRRAVLLGQLVENLANVAFCLGAVLFELGEALDGIEPAFQLARA